MARTFFVGGNFKMNGTRASVTNIIKDLKEATLDPNTEVVIAPPAMYLTLAEDAVSGSKISVAAQNIYNKGSGAFTGENGVDQLKDIGLEWVVLGHSERRTLFHETNEVVAEKTEFALANGLKVILCIGETLQERESGETMKVVTAQLAAVAAKINDWSNIVVAYEPVWAIGTGKTATAQQAQEVHEGIRKWFAKTVGQETADSIRIIYGGSVAAKNCRELASHPDIDGFLVGGASLKPEFKDIINARA